MLKITKQYSFGTASCGQVKQLSTCARLMRRSIEKEKTCSWSCTHYLILWHGCVWPLLEPALLYLLMMWLLTKAAGCIAQRTQWPPKHTSNEEVESSAMAESVILLKSKDHVFHTLKQKRPKNQQDLRIPGRASHQGRNKHLVMASRFQLVIDCYGLAIMYFGPLKGRSTCKSCFNSYTIHLIKM